MKLNNSLFSILIILIFFSSLTSAIPNPSVLECSIRVPEINMTATYEMYLDANACANVTIMDNGTTFTDIWANGAEGWLSVNESHMDGSDTSNMNNITGEGIDDRSNCINFNVAGIGVGNWSIYAFVSFWPYGSEINPEYIGNLSCGWLNVLDTTTTTTTSTTTTTLSSPIINDCWVMASTIDGTKIISAYSTLNSYVNVSVIQGDSELVDGWITINGSYLSESIREGLFNLSVGSNYLIFKGSNTGIGNWSIYAFANDTAGNNDSMDCGFFDMLDTTTTTTTSTIQTTSTSLTTTTTITYCSGSLTLDCEELNQSVCAEYYEFDVYYSQCYWEYPDGSPEGCYLAEEECITTTTTTLIGESIINDGNINWTYLASIISGSTLILGSILVVIIAIVPILIVLALVSFVVG